MRVLVGCEESGVVREAFRARGHDAWSCDLLVARDGSKHHLTCDILEAIARGPAWDAAVFFTPCTNLSVSGARWRTDHTVHLKKKKGVAHSPAECAAYGCYWHDGTEKRAAMKRDLALFRACFSSLIPKIAMENPVGMISTLFRPPDQYINPWQFGHGEQKKTGLWLHGLPLLKPTNIVEGREQRIWKMPPSATRQRDRSETFQGVADAMAAQWG